MRKLINTFWEDIEERFPMEYKKYTEWLNDYIFNHWLLGLYSQHNRMFGMPDAMQIGVFYQYTTENNTYHPFVIDSGDTIDHIVKAMKVWFFEEHASFLLREKE